MPLSVASHFLIDNTKSNYTNLFVKIVQIFISKEINDSEILQRWRELIIIANKFELYLIIFVIAGKGCYWALHTKCASMFENGSFLRRRKRFRLEGMEGNIKSVSMSPVNQPGHIDNLPRLATSDLSATKIDNMCLSPPSQQVNSLPPSAASQVYSPASTMLNQTLLHPSSTSSMFSNDQTANLAAYSQMLMQYYSMMSSLWSMNPMPSTPLYSQSSTMTEYTQMLYKMYGVAPSPSRQFSDLGSEGDRASPLSAHSIEHDNHCKQETTERALDLSPTAGIHF